MLTRRTLLWAGSASAMLASRVIAGQTPSASALPPAIDALPSFTGKVKPFTNEERRARIERAQELMRAQKIEAILLANDTTNTTYFANIRLGGSERLWALAIPAKAKPFLVCPAFEEARARELLAKGPLASNAEFVTWQEDESPFAATVKAFKDLGIATGKVGLDENMKFVFADSLAKAGPALTFVSAIPITAGCREIKQPHEIECLRVAGAATLAVYEAVYRSLKEGMTTRDVRTLVAQAYAKVGFPGEASLNIGAFTASPHGSAQPQTIREGTILMMDDGCVVEGFTSDITRTFVLGKPTEKMKAVFEIVQAAQTAALKAARPGVVTGKVDQAAREVIVRAGYGPGFKYFTHRVGHGLGMDMHEWPYFVDHNMYGPELHPVLQAGMVLSDEPGIYIPGEFGIRLEDDLHVTADGAELLTPQSKSLEDPFGKA